MRAFLSHTRVCFVIVCVVFCLRRIETESRFLRVRKAVRIAQLDLYAFVRRSSTRPQRWWIIILIVANQPLNKTRVENGFPAEPQSGIGETLAWFRVGWGFHTFLRSVHAHLASPCDFTWTVMFSSRFWCRTTYHLAIWYNSSHGAS